jgi:hypothetical protein
MLIDSSRFHIQFLLMHVIVVGRFSTLIGYAEKKLLQGHENASVDNGPWVITLDARSTKSRALREEFYRVVQGTISSTP